MKSRVLAALGTVVALLAALAVQQMFPASATAQAPSVAAFVAPSNLIQGVVVDQHGQPVDDVTVKAIRADGTTEASDQTYESKRDEGPQHGYFYLFVERGTYTLRLSKPGYETVVYDAGRISARVKKISMGEIEIEKLPAPTTTSATLDKTTVSTKANAAVDVTVKGEGKVSGDVEVREGSKVVGAGVAKNGKVTVTIKRLAKGDHVLTAYFLGTSEHQASSSKKLTLHVVKPKKKR